MARSAAVDYEVLELDKFFESMGIENTKLMNLQSQKKLCLILDLDHTLIHSTDEYNSRKTAEILGNADDIFQLKFWEIEFLVKLRPFVRKFLNEASKLFEMYIYTLATRDYAMRVVSLLDPDGVYFGSRIISSEDSTDKCQKSLDVLPDVDESFVLVLDDLKFVWSRHSRNLILMKKYVYFDPPNSVFRDETEGSGALSCALEVLKENIQNPESTSPIQNPKSINGRRTSRIEHSDILENEIAKTKPSTEGSVKPVKEEKLQKAKGQGTKRKWSKVWDTFVYIKGTSEEGDTAKCQKCGYTIPYNSSFGTGNLLKHQKTCTRSSDIRQMIISGSGGSTAMHSAKFDPMVFRDMITDAVAEITFQNQGFDVMKEFDALDCDQGTASEKSELDKYLEEKRLNKALDVDVLDYWSTNQFRFPNLALMDRDVLTNPISTVASESAFSVGGRVLDQYRSCLAHNIVESLICTRDWKFNEQEVYHNYPLEELTQDIMKLDITDHPNQDG
ncbi:hypothetical protein POM88_042177 [Heracleum sosnowskyi]|uniref:RNA polymerase II C-terminal domain phosphatase-like n=1 Tax=Heracleum sosnowskyi TaxID=360622 RepID=A0AAD8MAE9_9APIA|nr:hypothetical protein POM88_042177 [Heracleum sosnowskyi]